MAIFVCFEPTIILKLMLDRKYVATIYFYSFIGCSSTYTGRNVYWTMYVHIYVLHLQESWTNITKEEMFIISLLHNAKVLKN